jgi:hypothetical protein
MEGDTGSSSTTTADSAAPVTAADPVDATAGGVTSPQSDSPTTASDADEDIDSEYAEFKGTTTKAKPAQAASSDDDGDADNGDDDADDDGDAVDTLSDDDKQTIKRHGLDPDEIAALRALSPESRKKWIGNLDKRAKFTDDLQRQLAEIQGGKKPAAEAADGDDDDDAQANNAGADDDGDPINAATKEFADAFEPYGFTGLDAPLKKAFGAMAAQQKQAFAPIQKLLGAVLDRYTAEDQDAAFAALELPEGVDKTDAKIRKQILAEADLLLNGNFDFQKFNYRHAIPRAAQSVFNKQIQTAEKARKDRERRQALRGTAEPSTRAPSSKPVIDDDDAFDDEVLAAMKSGNTKKLEQLTAG